MEESTMKRLVMSSAALLMLAVFSAAASADDVAVRVSGGGKAVITDPDDNEFAGNHFVVAGVVYTDGSADGRVHFQLGEAFSAVWGALPGVDLIRLRGEITAGAVAEDGSVTLQGRLTEVDYSDGDVVFVEEDVPFEIVIPAGGGQFTLTWCLLPIFDLEVTHGKLHVK
jgi:hypothetical protein